MSDKITEQEKQAGVIAFHQGNLPKVKDADALFAHARKHTNEFGFVNYRDRVEFLEANGYELTRENFIDSNLSVKDPEENT